MSENSNSAAENTMRWLDLSKYGIDFKISPAIEGVRDKACILHINDIEKFLNTTGRNANQLGQLIVDSNFKLYPSETANKSPNQLTLVYDLEYNPRTKGTSLHLPDIVHFVGCQTKDNLEFIVRPKDDHLYKPDAVNTLEWRSVLKELNQKVADTHFYRPKNDAEPESLLVTIERLKKDSHPLFIRNYLDDPLPFNELAAMGYSSNVVSTVFPSLKQAQDAGYTIDDLDVIQPATDKICPLPFGVNKDGSLNIINDIRKVPELFNYPPSNHQAWIGRFELQNEVEQLIALSSDIRELSTSQSTPSNEADLEVHLESVSVALSRVSKFAKTKSPNRHNVRFNRRSQTMLLKNPQDNRWYHCERLDGKYTHKEVLNQKNYAHIMRALSESAQALTRSIDQNQVLVTKLRPLQEKIISQSVENFVRITSDNQNDLDLAARKPHQRVLDKQVNNADGVTNVVQSQDNILKMIQSVPDDVANKSIQDSSAIIATSTAYVAPEVQKPLAYVNPLDTPENRAKMEEFNLNKAEEIRKIVEDRRVQFNATLSNKDVALLNADVKQYVAPTEGNKSLEDATAIAKKSDTAPEALVDKVEVKKVLENSTPEPVSNILDIEYQGLKDTVSLISTLPRGFNEKSDSDYAMASALYEYKQQLAFIELPVAKQRVQDAQSNLEQIDLSASTKVNLAIKDFCKNKDIDLLQSSLETSESRNDAIRVLDAARFEESVVKAKLNNTAHQFQKRYVEANQLELSGRVRSTSLENLVMQSDANGKYKPFATAVDYQTAQERASEAYLRLANHSNFKPLEHSFIKALDSAVRSELASHRNETEDQLKFLSKNLHKFENPVSLLNENIIVPKQIHPFGLNDLHKSVLEACHLYINQPNQKANELKPSDFEKLNQRLDQSLSIIGRLVQRQQETIGEKVDFYNDSKVTAVLSHFAQEQSLVAGQKNTGEHHLPLSLKAKLDVLEKITSTAISTRNHLGFDLPKDNANTNWAVTSSISNIAKAIDYDRFSKVTPEFEKGQALSFVLNKIEAYPPKHDSNIKSQGWAITVDGKANDYVLKPVDLNAVPNGGEQHLKSKDYQSALSESFAIYRKNWVLNELNISGQEAKLINQVVVELKASTPNEDQVRNLTKQLFGAELSATELKSVKDFSIESKQLNSFTKVEVASFTGVDNAAFKELPLNHAQNIMDRINLTNRLLSNVSVNDPIIDYATKPSESFEQLKNYMKPNSQELKLQLESPAIDQRQNHASQIAKLAFDEYQNKSVNLVTNEAAKSAGLIVVSYQPKSTEEVPFTRAIPQNLDIAGSLKSGNNLGLVFNDSFYEGNALEKIQASVASTYLGNGQDSIQAKLPAEKLGNYATPSEIKNISENQKQALSCKINNPDDFLAVTTANMLASVISHEVALQNMSPNLNSFAKDLFNTINNTGSSKDSSSEMVQFYLTNSNQSDKLPTLRIASAFEQAPKDAVVVAEKVDLKEFLQNQVFVPKDSHFNPVEVNFKSTMAVADFKSYLDTAGFDYEKFLGKVNPLIKAEQDSKNDHLQKLEDAIKNNVKVEDYYAQNLQKQITELTAVHPEQKDFVVSAKWGEVDLPRLFVQTNETADQSFSNFKDIGKVKANASIDELASFVSQNRESINPHSQKALFDAAPQFSIEVKDNAVKTQDIKDTRDFFISKMCELDSDFEKVQSVGLKGANVFIQKDGDVLNLSLAGSEAKADSLKSQGFYPLPYDKIESLAFPITEKHEPLTHNYAAIAAQVSALSKNFDVVSNENQFTIAKTAKSLEESKSFVAEYSQVAAAPEPQSFKVENRGEYSENLGKSFKYSTILEMDDATAKQSLTKNTLWKPISVEDAVSKKYMDLDAYILADAIRSSLPNKPIYTDLNDPAQTQRDRVYFNSLVSNTFKAVAETKTLGDLVENLNKAQTTILRECDDVAEQRKKYQLEVITAISSSPKEADRVLGLNRNTDDMAVGLKYVNNPSLSEAWNISVQKLLAHETISENSKSFVNMFNKFDLNASNPNERNALSDALYSRMEHKEPQQFEIQLNSHILESSNPIINKATQSHIDVVNTIASPDYKGPNVNKDMLNLSFGSGATNLSFSLTEKMGEHFKQLDQQFNLKNESGVASNLGSAIHFSNRGNTDYDHKHDVININVNDSNLNLNKLWAKALDHKAFQHEFNSTTAEDKAKLSNTSAPYMSMAISEGFTPTTDLGKAFADFQKLALGKSNDSEITFKEAQNQIQKGVDVKLSQLESQLVSLRSEMPEVAKYVDWNITKGLDLNERLNAKLDSKMAKDYKVLKDDQSISGYNDSLNEANKRIDSIKLGVSALNVGMAVKALYPNESADFKHETTDKIINFASNEKFDQVNKAFTEYVAAKQSADIIGLINKHAPDSLKDSHQLCVALESTYIGNYSGITANGVKSEILHSQEFANLSIAEVKKEHEAVSDAISNVLAIQNSPNELSVSNDLKVNYSDAINSTPNHVELATSLKSTMDQVNLAANEVDSVFKPKAIESTSQITLEDAVKRKESSSDLSM